MKYNLLGEDMSIINLSNFVPYELKIDVEKSQIIKADNIPLNFSIRKLFDIKEVIYDQKWIENQKKNIDLYFMYRDFTRKEDKYLFDQYSIRFDITIIPPKSLGKEFNKTAGHFHPDAKIGHSYPEVYEVMSGKGIYLLQKESKDEKLIEILIIKAKTGDQILIPPGYGHITINPTKNKLLVMNNLVSSKFNSIYEPIKTKKGAAYFLLKNGKWIRNLEYSKEIIIKKAKPNRITDKPFYLAFLKNPEQWIFLNEPWIKNDW